MYYIRPFSFLLFLLFSIFSVFLHSQEHLIEVFEGSGSSPVVIGTIENSILFDIDGDIWISGGTTDSTVKLLDAEEDHKVSHSRVTLNGKYYFV